MKCIGQSIPIIDSLICRVIIDKDMENVTISHLSTCNK